MQIFDSLASEYTCIYLQYSDHISLIKQKLHSFEITVGWELDTTSCTLYKTKYNYDILNIQVIHVVPYHCMKLPIMINLIV